MAAELLSFKTTKLTVKYSKVSRFGKGGNMKKLIFFLTMIFMAALTANVFGQTGKQIKLSIGKQTVDKASKITFKLIGVEDSRCPPDANCVWAGNAKLNISIAKGKSAAKMFELNSSLDPKMFVFEGYEIAFKEITPKQNSTASTPQKYLAKITMVKRKKN
jgi:hypothetical protein